MTKSGGQGRQPRRGASHASCSKKRTLLKERLRQLEGRMLACVGRLSTMESRLGIVMQEEE